MAKSKSPKEEPLGDEISLSDADEAALEAAENARGGGPETTDAGIKERARLMAEILVHVAGKKKK